jgi:hypothetical protein
MKPSQPPASGVAPRNLWQWITDARAADLPHVHSFARGLSLDIQSAPPPPPSRTTTDAPCSSCPQAFSWMLLSVRDRVARKSRSGWSNTTLAAEARVRR